MREIFSLPGDYSNIAHELLSKAEGDVFIFDPSLRDLWLDSGKGFDALVMFFERTPKNRLLMVLKSDLWLKTEALRVPALLVAHSAQVQIRMAGSAGLAVEDCFLVAPKEAVRKVVADSHSGARLSREEPDYSAYISRWGELWEESEAGAPIRPLGL